MREQGKCIMVGVSICQVGRPDSSPVQSACFRKVVCYQNVKNLSPPVPTTGSPKAIHVVLCLCKRSLVICHKSRAGFCLSLYGLHVLNRDLNIIQTKKSYLYDRYLLHGIFYMQYHTDMKTHSTFFVEPDTGTGWSKLVTRS